MWCVVVDVRLCLWYFALLGGGGADEGNTAGRAREGRWRWRWLWAAAWCVVVDVRMCLWYVALLGGVGCRCGAWA